MVREGRRRYEGEYVGYARARVECIPSPYDTAALPYKVKEAVLQNVSDAKQKWHLLLKVFLSLKTFALPRSCFGNF